MASIEIRDTKDGKRAYRFQAFLGKDASGKRIFETTTWKPSESLTAAKEKRLAETEAYRWEQQIKGGISIIPAIVFSNSWLQNNQPLLTQKQKHAIIFAGWWKT